MFGYKVPLNFCYVKLSLNSRVFQSGIIMSVICVHILNDCVLFLDGVGRSNVC